MCSDAQRKGRLNSGAEWDIFKGPGPGNGARIVSAEMKFDQLSLAVSGEEGYYENNFFLIKDWKVLVWDFVGIYTMPLLVFPFSFSFEV